MSKKLSEKDRAALKAWMNMTEEQRYQARWQKEQDRQAELLKAADPAQFVNELEAHTAAPTRSAAYNALGGQPIEGVPSGVQVNQAAGLNLPTEVNYGTSLPSTLLKLINAPKLNPEAIAGAITEMGLDPLNLVGLLPEKVLAKVGAAALKLAPGAMASVEKKVSPKILNKFHGSYELPNGDKAIKVGEYGDISYKSPKGIVEISPSNIDSAIEYDSKLEKFLSKHENPAKVEHVESYEPGAGSSILKDAEAAAKAQGHDAVYLNASPLQNSKSGTRKSIDDLVNFYKKNGYEVVNHEGGNAVMYKPLAGGVGAVNKAGLNTVLKSDQIVNQENGYAQGGLVQNSIARIKRGYAEGGTVSNQEFTEEEIKAEMQRMDAEANGAVQANPNNGDEISDEELSAEIENEKKYGDRFLETAALTAADIATYSLAPRALEKMGVYEPGEIALKQEYNPYAVPVGTTAGIVVPALLTEGTSLLGAAARATPVGVAAKIGTAAENAVANLLKKSAEKKLTKEVINKSLKHKVAENLARGAAEGGAFGIADLASENAMGRAEFNGENLLNYIGSGALASGLTMGAFPVIGAGGRIVGRGGKAVFDKTMAKVADPVKDVFTLMGHTPKSFSKLSESYKGRFLAWLGERFGAKAISNTDELLSSMQKLNKSAQAEADSIIDDISLQIGNQPGVVNKGAKTFREILNHIDDAIAKEAEFGAMKDSAALSSLGKMRAQVIDRIESGKAFTPKDYRTFRQGYDELSNWKSIEPKPVQQVARDLRTKLNNTMHDLVEVVDPAKAATLRQNFEDMHYTIDSIRTLSNKEAKSVNIMPAALETLKGAGLFHLFGGWGAALAGAETFMKSDLKRKLVVMKAIKKANDKTEELTKSAIETFLSKAKPGKRAADVSALMAASIAMPEGSKEKPKNRQEAYTNTINNLNKFMTEPEALMNKAAKATASISREAPLTAQVASSRLINGVQFLASKIPKSPYLESVPGLKRKEYTPSSMELAKFERYMQIVEMPLTVLSELQAGTLTRDHVEALQAVYPEMYNYIRNSMINKLNTEEGLEMSYNKRIQMGILLDIASDASMLGHNIGALQQNFKVNENADGSQTPVGNQPVVSPTQGGAEKLNMSERDATGTQAFMQRKQGA